VIYMSKLLSTPPGVFVRLLVHEMGHATFEKILLHDSSMPHELDANKVPEMLAHFGTGVPIEKGELSDLGRRCVLNLEHCALTYLADRQSEHADATVTLERAVLDRLILRELLLADAVQRGLVSIDGDPAKVAELFGLLDDFTLMFEVVEPRRER